MRRRKSVGGTYDEHRQQRGAHAKDCTHSLRRHRASAVPPCPGGDSDRLGAEARRPLEQAQATPPPERRAGQSATGTGG